MNGVSIRTTNYDRATEACQTAQGWYVGGSVGVRIRAGSWDKGVDRLGATSLPTSNGRRDLMIKLGLSEWYDSWTGGFVLLAHSL